MRLEKLEIKNYRGFRDSTISFSKYTSLVGPNGSGKSTILMALNILFRNKADVSTDVQILTEEDFHNKDTSNPIEIRGTFIDLSAEAGQALQHYVRNDKLIFTAKAIWDESKLHAEVIQFGARLGIAAFKPFFEAHKANKGAPELNRIYGELQQLYPDIPNARSKDDKAETLRTFESEHQGLCALIDSEDQFFGFQGAGKLDPYFQWVYIPALKDAASEQEESKNTAFGKLLERTIRSRVNFSEQLAPLKEELRTKYEAVLRAQDSVLDDVSDSLQALLQEWAHPDAKVKLSWNFDPGKSLRIEAPLARAEVGEKRFLGDIRRMGHGLQRAFIVSVLQLLARSKQEEAPTLLLGFEEPEVYQHPPQARHLAKLLEDMENTQVVISTHSPYFISGKGVENIRLVRWNDSADCSLVSHLTLEKLSACVGDALGERPAEPSSCMATIQQIMQPSLNELYFSGRAILVEGIEDVAFMSTQIELMGKMMEFKRQGGHFIVCGGKNSMSRPLAIAKELSIPFFVVFDGDSDKNGKEDVKKSNKRDNKCILKLCSVTSIDPLSSDIYFGDNVVMWGTNIRDTIRNEIGADAWDTVQQAMVELHGYGDITNKKKNEMVIVAVLQQLWENGRKSSLLEELCNRLLT
jgi:predicted ATP-dependent endonuclease of OLD family